MASKSFWYRNGALRVNSSGNPVYGDDPVACCCPGGCPCIEDAARASQTVQGGILLSDTSTNGYFDGKVVPFVQYFNGIWSYELSFTTGSGDDTKYYDVYIDFECRGDDRWYASGFFVEYITGNGCYYAFDEPVCPLPVPRVDASGSFGGAFTINRLFTKRSNFEVWSKETVYTVGSNVMPSVPNGHFYLIDTGDGPGTSGATEPAWSTVHGDHTADGDDLLWTTVADNCPEPYAASMGMEFVKPVMVTINQAAGQGDPTNTSPVNFTVVFSRAVTDFTEACVTISGTATTGTKTVTSNDGGVGKSYNVAVVVTVSGTVIGAIDSDVAHDIDGVPNSTATGSDQQVTFDIVAPLPTVSYLGTTPSSASTITFNVSFTDGNTLTSESVVGFTVASPGGTAGATTAVVTAVSGSSYTVAVTGMTTDGTVTLHVDASVTTDLAGNANTESNTATMDWFIPVANRTISTAGCSPDVRGTYVNVGSSNGKPLYYSGSYYLCWYPGTPGDWLITSSFPSLNVKFNRTDASVLGVYGPQGGSSGNPEVT